MGSDSWEPGVGCCKDLLCCGQRKWCEPAFLLRVGSPAGSGWGSSTWEDRLGQLQKAPGDPRTLCLRASCLTQLSSLPSHQVISVLSLAICRSCPAHAVPGLGMCVVCLHSGAEGGVCYQRPNKQKTQHPLFLTATIAPPQKKEKKIHSTENKEAISEWLCVPRAGRDDSIGQVPGVYSRGPELGAPACEKAGHSAVHLVPCTG